jgi:SAM-dependent methyltransferase
MDPVDRDLPALSFGTAAELYDRIRPSYPTAAVRWILEPAARAEPRDGGPAVRDRSNCLGPTANDRLRVLDLGAGTGILTRAVGALGHEVVPVEPDPAMRARLVAATGGITPLAGTAERIPLPDASVDAVVVGQAYHWFDPDRAHPEIARVLRPGGVFGPLWNDRDENISWLAELSVIADNTAGRQGSPHPDRLALVPWFAPAEQATFRHSATHSADSLIDLVMSRSYYLTAPADRQVRIIAAVRELASRHPELAGLAEFELPYVTTAYRAIRSPTGDPVPRSEPSCARRPGEARSG